MGERAYGCPRARSDVRVRASRARCNARVHPEDARVRALMYQCTPRVSAVMHEWTPRVRAVVRKCIRGFPRRARLGKKGAMGKFRCTISH